VKALLHSVYDQPDGDALHAQFVRILDALIDKLLSAYYLICRSPYDLMCRSVSARLSRLPPE
jgi:hypothetical protein